jgi:hypothetical protein
MLTYQLSMYKIEVQGVPQDSSFSLVPDYQQQVSIGVIAREHEGTENFTFVDKMKKLMLFFLVRIITYHLNHIRMLS